MKRLIFVAMLAAGCGGTEPPVSAAGAWNSSLQSATEIETLTMSISQDDAGHLTGPATLGDTAGTVVGDINGRENAYLVLRFPHDSIVLQVAGLPNRMFGSAYVNGTSGVAMEAIRH